MLCAGKFAYTHDFLWGEGYWNVIFPFQTNQQRLNFLPLEVPVKLQRLKPDSEPMFM